MNISKTNQIILITIALVKILNKMLNDSFQLNPAICLNYLIQSPFNRRFTVTLCLGGSWGKKKQLTLTLPFLLKQEVSAKKAGKLPRHPLNFLLFKYIFRALIRVSSVAEPLRRMVTQVPLKLYLQKGVKFLIFIILFEFVESCF